MMVIGRGGKGPSVRTIQERLKELGFDPGDIDGIFGQATEEAVKAFQRERGLPADGLAGQQVIKALNVLRDAGKPATAPKVSEELPRTKVFISYSRQDTRWLKDLQKHLTPLEESDLIIRWDDTMIAAGQDWQAEIDTALKTAKVAILLVSENFMSSKYVRAYELPSLLASADKILILPVILTPCYLGELSKIQSLNSPSKTISEMTRPNQARVWLKLVETIMGTLEGKSD